MTISPRPSRGELEIAIDLLAPFRALTRPKFLGLERVPKKRPLLFVGNHTLFGLLDVPFFFTELYEQHGIVLRALGDHAHFGIPVWGDLLKRFGVVDGTRENCAALMEARETILVFPGGAREVAKRKGEKYQLLWKDRVGFARMAIRHGCTIVPFAAVGADDAFDIVLDGDDFLKSPLGRIAKKLGLRDDFIPPIARGFRGSPLPKPERLYFWIGDAIGTSDGGDDEDAAARRVRDQTKRAVESGLAELLAFREKDPKRLPRLLR